MDSLFDIKAFETEDWTRMSNDEISRRDYLKLRGKIDRAGKEENPANPAG